MTSIDDLFKKPALPSNKRKLESTRHPSEVYKSVKLSKSSEANGKIQATEHDDDIEAGPIAPEDDSYGPDLPDDEDGRFFGGGITKEESEILDYMEDQNGADVMSDKIDAAWVRKLALNFEKRISKNAELRAKFENDPQKFMGSEADLDADIKALSILAEHPGLYAEFAKLGCVHSLVSLLAHDNTDISIDAIEIISELTDEDVDAEPEQWNALVDEMLESDLLDLLVSNFSRFDESIESDRSGVYHALCVLENLASRVSVAEKIGLDTTVLQWLLKRIQKKESPVTQNKQYAAEVLAILLQSSSSNKRRLVKLDGVDLLLQLLSTYRKKDPLKGSEEEEYVENLFDSLTCVVNESEGKHAFVEAEGVELGLIMIREGKMSKYRALRLLDHALAGYAGAAVCERLVEAAGLKLVFGMFMRKQNSQTTEHLLGIFASLLKGLPANSSGRIRTLAKFVENDYEKPAKLLKLRTDYAIRLSSVDEEIRAEQARLGVDEREEKSDEWLSRRLDAGLFCLQTIDIILAWLVAEDDGAAARIRKLFSDRNESLALVRATIQEQLDADVDAETEEGRFTRDMMTTLIQFLV